MSADAEPRPYHAGGDPAAAVPVPPTAERLLQDLEGVLTVLRDPAHTPELADLATQIEHLEQPAPSTGMRLVAEWASRWDLVLDPATDRQVRDRLMQLVADVTEPEPVRWRLAWVLSQQTHRWPTALAYWQWLLTRETATDGEDPLLWWVRAEWVPQAICSAGPYAPASPWSLWVAHAETLDGPALVRAAAWLRHGFGPRAIQQLPEALRTALVRAQQAHDQQEAAWRDPARAAFDRMRRLFQRLEADDTAQAPAWETAARWDDAAQPPVPLLLLTAWAAARRHQTPESQELTSWLEQAMLGCPDDAMDVALDERIRTDAEAREALRVVRDRRAVRQLTQSLDR